MAELPVLIAGGGIGGLAVALTLQQIGVPCLVLEAVPELKPLGVGINLQPNAVRELYELGLGPDQLDTIGVQAREWALVGLNGKDVYSEPRGLLAGYRWPQYALHRGGLQMLLYRTAIERLGACAVLTGHRVAGYRNEADSVGVLVRTADGKSTEIRAKLLIAADGLHSAVRAQMHPNQPPIQWGGAIMWRGTTPGVPIRRQRTSGEAGDSGARLVVGRRRMRVLDPDSHKGMCILRALVVHRKNVAVSAVCGVNATAVAGRCARLFRSLPDERPPGKSLPRC
jgi:2-polyprenyl-6-methoxyphenol hydroxylase-like FAD-dependent oxidoreductase